MTSTPSPRSHALRGALAALAAAALALLTGWAVDVLLSEPSATGKPAVLLPPLLAPLLSLITLWIARVPLPVAAGAIALPLHLAWSLAIATWGDLVDPGDAYIPAITGLGIAGFTVFTALGAHLMARFDSHRTREKSSPRG
ncbi:MULTISPECIES: hypothetical protein [unclassified Nocardiopsis]|uniref:hypothetical protein n=1 Tax=Nocardiopsis TaxID=2013 RepID=UPI00387ABBB5